MHIRIIDLETSVDSPIGDHKASPFWPMNQIVCTGASDLYEEDEAYAIEGRCMCLFQDIIVGQNVVFDLHYLRRDDITLITEDGRNWWNHGAVWDTQLAEFILTGGMSKFASLDDLAKKYGGTPKIDIIKEMWDSGVRTEDIDITLLLKYCRDDVTNTAIVAREQMKDAVATDMLPLITSQMSALMAVQEIEYNGIRIDRELLIQQGLLESAATFNYKEESDEYIREILEHEGVPVSVLLDTPALSTSSKVLGAVLFGGKFNYTEREVVGRYKNGKIKYKNISKTVTLPSTGIKKSMTLKGNAKVGEEVLEQIAKGTHRHSVLAEKVLEYRRHKKELDLILKIESLIFPDGNIHPHFNQVSIPTGRLSCSSPNVQQFPNKDYSDIKSTVISRYSNGYLIEADYSQIEIVALAFLSQDPQLIEDLENGIDLHAETGRSVYGRSLVDAERRTVKGVNFGLIYGGSYTTISEQTGANVQIVKALIDAFYKRYPRVRVYQEEVRDIVKESRKSNKDGKMTKKGYPSGIGVYVTPTSRVLTFREYDAPSWLQAPVSFSPTEMKNYPVQSLATGDIVPMMLGVMRYRIKEDKKWAKLLMINTVHDSILFDCPNELHDEAVVFIRETLESAPAVFEEVFGIEFDLPLKVEIKSGRDWKHLKRVE